MANINKPSREAIQAQLEEEGDTPLARAREIIKQQRKDLYRCREQLKVYLCPEGGKKANAVIQRMSEILLGLDKPTVEQIDWVFKHHGHFLLRFPNGQLIPEHDPSKARLYVTESARFRVLPENWLVVNSRGELSSVRLIKETIISAKGYVSDK